MRILSQTTKINLCLYEGLGINPLELIKRIKTVIVYDIHSIRFPVKKYGLFRVIIALFPVMNIDTSRD